MYSKLLSVALFFLVLAKSHAQKFELGQVSVAELAEKVHPVDSSAAAAILFHKGEVQIDGDGMTTNVKIRIKIYKKDGYQWANKAMTYYSKNNATKLDFSNAVTFNLVDGQIVKTKLKNEGQFVEKINKHFTRKKIVLPDVREFSVIEYEYSMHTGVSPVIPTWDFQTVIPVNYSEYTTMIPDYLRYKVSQNGNILPEISSEVREKTMNLGGSRRKYYQEFKKRYVAKNLPAVVGDVYVNNMDTYLASISHELAATMNSWGGFSALATDWESIAKRIYKSEGFGEELSSKGYFESAVDSVKKQAHTRDEIIEAVFSLVKEKVKWDETAGVLCRNGVRDAFESGRGNAAEINLMLVSMLRYAGLSANPVLISTRGNGIPLEPSNKAFNFVIAAVEIENDVILMDATEKESAPGVLPFRDLNWIGRLIREEGSSNQVELMPKSISRTAVNLSVVLNSAGTADGKLRSMYSDHKALEFRKSIAEKDDNTYLTDLENLYNNIEITEYKRENESKVLEPATEFFLFKDSNDVEKINDKIYFSPFLFLAQKENPFKRDKREYPVDFGYPSENKYIINIELPEGYTVEYLPKSEYLVLEQGMGAFKFAIANTDNKIQLSVSKTINYPVILPEYYEVLKTFFQKTVEKQNEKIVLKKV